MSKAQLQFMLACGQTAHRVNFKQIELYQELIREEVVKELFPALDSWVADPLDKEKIRAVLDGIGDTLVVVEGLALSMGVDIAKVKDAVDVSNLTKVPTGSAEVRRREDGKIFKPAHFQEPDLRASVDEVYRKLTTVLG